MDSNYQMYQFFLVLFILNWPQNTESNSGINLESNIDENGKDLPDASRVIQTLSLRCVDCRPTCCAEKTCKKQQWKCTNPLCFPDCPETCLAKGCCKSKRKNCKGHLGCCAMRCRRPICRKSKKKSKRNKKKSKSRRNKV